MFPFLLEFKIRVFIVIIFLARILKLIAVGSKIPERDYTGNWHSGMTISQISV